MGKDLGEPIFIEFIGLPASGKTTLSHIVADRLRSIGYEVSEPNYDIVHNNNGIGRVLSKLCVFLKFRLTYPVEYKQIKRIVDSNSYHGVSAKKHLVNLILKVSAYHNYKKGIIIWDQGIYQAIISLSITGRQNCIENKKELLHNGFINGNIIKIFLDTPVDVAIQRLENRRDGKSRIDKIADVDERRKEMMRFEECCNSLIDKETKSIDGLLSTEKQVEIILELLNSKIYSSLKIQYTA